MGDDDNPTVQDLAADLRDAGLSWVQIADKLDVTATVARRLAAAADTRADERAARDQIALF